MSNGRRLKFKFSFVMPVYNVEAYLEETIESILAQTLNFKDSCQIIFINDGSPDDSEAICLKYKNICPDNIVYIKQTNQGVSAARNKGIELAEGKYISFLDSDDKISPDTLKEVYGFFEKNYDQVDVVTIKLMFFEAKSGPHALNHRFDSTRVVDITKEYNCIHRSGGASFVKTEAIKGIHEFDTRLKVSEDGAFLTRLILEKGAYGVLADPIYYYRRRRVKDSAVSTVSVNRSWYFDTILYTYGHLIQDLEKDFGYKVLPRYVQYFIAYDLQWRFKQDYQTILTDEEEDTYKQSLISLLKYVDDDIILEQKRISVEDKLFMLQKKHNTNIIPQLEQRGLEYYFNNNKVYDYSWALKALIESVQISGDKIILEGRLWGLKLPGVQFGFLIDNEFRQADEKNRPDIDKHFFDEKSFEGKGFSISIPAKNGLVIKPCIVVGGGEQIVLQYACTNQSKLLDFVGKPYKMLGKFLVCQPDSRTIYIDKNNFTKKLIKEAAYLWSRRTTSLRVKFTLTAFRAVSILLKSFMQKEIWIISDRVNAAGDNGEAFFRYLQNKKNRSTKVYFSIKKSSDDYDRLKSYGKVIDRDGWFYKLLFLCADKVISSHADDLVTNAFGEDQKSMRDLYNFEFIYLGHGINLYDTSKWLNKYKTNISLFITSVKKEYDLIIKEDYFYSKKNVTLSGLPRYDLLTSAPKNKVVIAPTWRRGLASGVDPSSGMRPYKNLFKLTDYFKFYNDLINDKRLIKVLETNDCTLEFYTHPEHMRQQRDFIGNDRCKVMKLPYDYNKALKEGSLLVTDYSSVAFDFSYIKKPVIYTQFDRDTFFNTRMIKKDHFSYERNGLGSVVYDYDSTIDAIIKSIENGFTVENKYKERANKFFTYSDNDNCKRVYEAISAMDREK